MAFGARQNAAALTPMEVSLFFREYFLLFESGIGLSDAAYIMAENSADDRAALCKGIAERIDEGTPLSQALAETGRFPHHALHMVEIGQTSGRLDSVLEGLALYYERQDRLENSIRSALTYPLIMIGVMAAVLGVLVIKVLPMFGAVFKDTGAKMPLILRLVTESSGFTALLIGIIIAVLVLLIIAFRGAGKALTSGEDAKGILASLPFMKQIMEKTASGNFAYTMALLLSGGVPIESALEQTME
ncbi:MAG: type II secretion system F family protein, partial [Eubacterium sp.]|nr:type II secretion system F family protein [Candidatus Colimonas fimequi]